MDKHELGNVVFTNVCDALPEANGAQAFVYIKTANGRIWKGMYFMNGGKPTFASYGSEIANVVAWAYR